MHAVYAVYALSLWQKTKKCCSACGTCRRLPADSLLCHVAVHCRMHIGHGASDSSAACSLAPTRPAAATAAISAATGAHQPTSSSGVSSSAAQPTEMAAKAIATPTSFAALAALAASIATRTMHQYPGRLVRSKGPQQMRLTSHL